MPITIRWVQRQACQSFLEGSEDLLTSLIACTNASSNNAQEHSKKLFLDLANVTLGPSHTGEIMADTSLRLPSSGTNRPEAQPIRSHNAIRTVCNW